LPWDQLSLPSTPWQNVDSLFFIIWRYCKEAESMMKDSIMINKKQNVDTEVSYFFNITPIYYYFTMRL
jgi:hypothetical protein